jgi:hypothetical protein
MNQREYQKALLERIKTLNILKDLLVISGELNDVTKLLLDRGVVPSELVRAMQLIDSFVERVYPDNI